MVTLEDLHQGSGHKERQVATQVTPSELGQHNGGGGEEYKGSGLFSGGVCVNPA